MKPVLNGSAQNQYIENTGAHPQWVTRAWRRHTLCKMLAKIFTRSYVRERPSYICCVLLALSHFITKEFIAFVTPEAVCIFVVFLSSSFKQKLNTIIFLAFTKQAEKSQPRKQHTSCLLAQCIHIPAQLSFPQSLLLPFPSFREGSVRPAHKNTYSTSWIQAMKQAVHRSTPTLTPKDSRPWQSSSPGLELSRCLQISQSLAYLANPVWPSHFTLISPPKEMLQFHQNRNLPTN